MRRFCWWLVCRRKSVKWWLVGRGFNTWYSIGPVSFPIPRRWH